MSREWIKEMAKDWIKEAVGGKHKGGLHRSLHVPEGERIHEAKVEAATHSKSPKIRKEANLAKTLKGLR